ncbi:hypothetical protein [Panacibacter ginsenosidivorans]|nr:hypothetical protein [Panacibacter ginsenosidivorans]
MYPHSLSAKDILLKASVVEQGMIWQCTTLYRVVIVVDVEAVSATDRIS